MEQMYSSYGSQANQLQLPSYGIGLGPLQLPPQASQLSKYETYEKNFHIERRASQEKIENTAANTRQKF